MDAIANRTIKQMIQITTVTKEENLIYPEILDDLIAVGYAYKIYGYSTLTENGIIVLSNLGVI